MGVAPERLRRIPRFSGMDEATYAWLGDNLRREDFDRGEMLYLEGEEPPRLWIVERGTVKVFRSLESGRELILGLFRFGDPMGEVAVLDRLPYPASAAAHEDATVLSMSAEAYFHYLRTFDGASTALIRDLTFRIRTMQQRMKDLGGGGVDFRLARVLRALASAHGKGDGAVVPSSVTRQDLADMIGARVETVIRVMSRWQKEGVLVGEGRDLRIADPAALDALGEEL